MKKLLLLFLLVSLFTSCNETHIYQKYNRIPDYTWNENSPLTFRVTVDNISNKYDIYLNLRNTNFYRFSNIWLIINKADPAGNKLFHQRFEFLLADKNGKWTGNGLGDIIDNQFLIEKNIQFHEKGIYTYTMYQNMRLPDLTGIMDVGIEIRIAR